MKYIYSLLIAFAATSPFVEAKTTGIGIPNIFPHMGSGGTGNNAPAANYSRIVGYTYLKHNGTNFIPVDSTTYSYSFGRGGQLSKEDMDDNFVKFDHSYTYRYIPSSGSYRNDMHRWQTFNNAGKAQTYTIEKWDTISNNTWNSWGRYIYQYNNDLTLLNRTNFEIWFGGMWVQHYQYNNFYNGNDIVRMRSTAFIMSFSYDANKNIISREDSSYNVSGSYWYRDQKLLFAYDANNRITSYIVQEGVGNNWVNVEKHEHTYTGNNITLTMSYTWNNGVWELSGQHIRAYDVNNNITSDEWQYWDVATTAYKSASRNVWTYNTYSQPLTYYSETYDASTNSWSSTSDDFFYRYYYQSFIPASVNNVTSAEELKIYPQPAQNSLNIDLAENVVGAYTISILDVQGKIVKQQSNTNAVNGNENIDVSHLPNGTYFLKLVAKDLQLSKQFIISR